MRNVSKLFAAFLFMVTLAGPHAEGKGPPEVGQRAEDFSLKSVGGETVRLSALTKQGPVVLSVLRGYPGYQCSLCSRQVAELRRHAADFNKAGARVVLVYPGPGKALAKRAREFLDKSMLPEPLALVLDPDYKFTNAYGLRWDAPRETAYPSTFVVDRGNTVRYRKVSKAHGGRARTIDVLKALDELDRGGSADAGDLEPGGYILKPFSDDFRRLARIAGRWKGTKGGPDGAAEDIEVEYRLSSGNSVLIERLFKDSPHEMVSIYHDDGDSIMMTHYCGLGNQPRMRAEGFKGHALRFEFVDGSNMASESEAHMRTLTLTLVGPERLRHEWGMYKDGKKEHAEAFELTRVK